MPRPLSEETPCGSILLSDHKVFAFWVVAYGRFDGISSQDASVCAGRAVQKREITVTLTIVVLSS